MKGGDIRRAPPGILGLLVLVGHLGGANGEDIRAVIRDLSLEPEGKTPVVKRFDPAWVKSLTSRGEPYVYTKLNSAAFDYIGMPVGGICSGQLYLGGDGRLWYWDIFNTKSQRDVRGVGAYARPYQRSRPDLKAYNDIRQGFAVRIAAGGRTQRRTLDREGFSNVEFRGQYPIGLVKYSDPNVPVTVELEAFSPFAPLSLEDSTHPATVLVYTVTNTGRQAVEGQIAGWLENAVCLASRPTVAGQLRNRIERGADVTYLSCDATRPPAAAPVREPVKDIVFEDFEGPLAARWTVEGEAFQGGTKPNYHHQPLRGYVGKGLADSFWNAGKTNARAQDSDAPKGKLTSKPFKVERRAVRLLIGGGRHPGETCVNIVIDGRTVASATGDNSETLRPVVLDVSRHRGKTARIEIVDAHSGGWGHILVDQIVFTDKMTAESMPLEDLPDYGSMGLALLEASEGVFGRAKASVPEGLFEAGKPDTADVPFGASERLIGTLGKAFKLKSGEKTTVRYVVTWYFPNYVIGRLRTPSGRSYGKRFTSARDVAGHVAADFDRLTGQTRLWHKTWYDSTLPWWFLDRTFLNTSILATNTCYLFRDGRFYGYEGVYHGHGTCTHVWGYVQATGRLFPELERRLRERVDYNADVAFGDDGKIGYRSEFSRSDAVDGQSGIILRTYREHQMSQDDAFLRRNYRAMKKAMDYLVRTYDADEDGILTGGQHNTLDAKWYGKITWLSLHYGAALRAAGAMAEEMGDEKAARRFRTLADRGREYIEQKLFNGEYFFHEADPEHPESPGVFTGCEYSQLLGQSWAYQVGLGPILDARKVTTALRSLWKYNFSTDVGPFREKFQGGRWYAMPGEGGLIACTWPRGGSEVLSHGSRHFAGYLNECQAGYEYAATSLMMWHGLTAQALAHVRAVHDRYHGSKRNPWNEVEWGSHYSRSMASYGHFTAVCGFEHHGPRGYIAFSPRLTPEDFRAAFTSAAGWGTFSQKREQQKQTERIEVKWGSLRLKALAFDLPAGATARTVSVSCAGRRLEADFRMEASRVNITLRKAAIAEAGQAFEIEIGT